MRIPLNIIFFLILSLYSYGKKAVLPIPFKYLLIESYIDKAEEFNFNKPDSAIYFYQKALNIAHKQGFHYEEAMVIGRIGGVYYTLGNYDQALDYYRSSLNSFIPLHNKHGVAAGYNNCGMIYNIQMKMDDAIKAHQKSLSICLPESDYKLVGINYFNLSISYWQKQDFETALIYSDSAMSLFQQIEQEDQYCRVNNLKGYVYLSAGDYTAANNHFIKPLKQTRIITYGK